MAPRRSMIRMPTSLTRRVSPRCPPYRAVIPSVLLRVVSFSTPPKR